jgi:hypothetical protein
VMVDIGPRKLNGTVRGRLVLMLRPDVVVSHDAGLLGGADPVEQHRRWRGGQEPGDVLRLGVMYADGRRTATTAGHPFLDDDADAGRLVLLQDGGGGDARRWDGDFWVHPLPPEGPVTFVVSWPKRGVAENRGELDSAAIRAAAQRAVTLWPEEPESDAGSASWRTEVTAFRRDDPDAGPGADRPGTGDPGTGG